MERTTITRFALLGLLAIGLWACEDAPPPPAATPPASPPGSAATGLQVLTGSGDPNSGAPATPATDAPADPATGAPAAPTEGSEEDVNEIAYAYSPIGKRDPFRSLFDQLQRDDATQQLTELQKFELDQLRLVAIVSRIATPYAMVEDPSGKGHTLTRGTLIGKNWGRVAQIDPECVVIKEEYRDYTGRKVTNKTSMCLPKPSDLKLD